MENKEAHNTTTINKPIGSMCEKLFNAFNTTNTFRPLRRLTNWQQNSEPQDEIQSNNFPSTAATDAKHKVPSPPHPEKPKVALTPLFAKNDVKGSDQKDAPTIINKKDAKGTQPNAIPVPVPPKGVTMPQPARPKGTTMPLPAQPTDEASTDTLDTKPKKSLNEKVEDYIQRTKGKLRSTTLPRTQSAK